MRSGAVETMNTISVERTQIVGFCGVALLFFGSFSPLFHVPIFGSINFVRNGTGDGVFVIALAVTATALLCVRAYAWVAAPAAGALIICSYAVLGFLSAVSQMQNAVNDMKDNPFAGIASALAESISLEWGWVFLLLGLLCLFAVAGSAWLIKSADGRPTRVADSTPPPLPKEPTTSSNSSPQRQPLSATNTMPQRSTFGQRRH